MPTGEQVTTVVKDEGEQKAETGKEQPDQIVNWDAWLGDQAVEIQTAYETHVQGLKNTVTATRTERDDYKKQLSGLLRKAEKGSDAEAQLQDALGKIEVAERRANFMEDALRPEIGCKNPRTAFALATAEDMFTKQGTPDWVSIKMAAPELFQILQAKGNAGSGTDGQNIKVVDMNTIIRQKAGRE